MGIRATITGVIDELIELATAYKCEFPIDFANRVIQQQIKPSDKFSYMYQDFTARRPMEVETYLGSPIRMGKDVGITLKRIETLYAVLHHKNLENMKNSDTLPAMQNPPPRSSSVAGPGPRPMGGMPNGGRPPRGQSFGGPPGMTRRGGPGPGGYGGRMANGGGNNSQYNSRRPSVDGNDLQEFSHLMLYDQAPEGGFTEGSSGVYGEPNMGSSTTDLALRERELAIRERELAIERQRMQMMRKGGRRQAQSRAGMYDDEDDEEGDYFDPMAAGVPNAAVMDENFDMMSVTSKRTRKTSVNNNGRFMGPPSRGGRPFLNNRRNRTSTSLIHDIPGLSDNIMDNGLMGYSSNRYGAVDRQTMGQESRQNSLTRQRLDELQRGGSYGGYPPLQRRSSQPPGNPMSPGPMSAPIRSSPQNGMGYGPPGMPPPNGMGRRPSPPGGMKMQQRPPPGNDPYAVASQAVSNPNLLKQSPQVRSLTGSASASLGDTSGASAHIDSEPSATSSQSSLGPRPRFGVRS